MRAIVTVEPMGPAFATIPHIGTLSWGLTAAPLTYDPSLSTPEQARAAEAATLRVPALTGIPIAVVTGGHRRSPATARASGNPSGRQVRTPS